MIKYINNNINYMSKLLYFFLICISLIIISGCEKSKEKQNNLSFESEQIIENQEFYDYENHDYKCELDKNIDQFLRPVVNDIFNDSKFINDQDCNTPPVYFSYITKNKFLEQDTEKFFTQLISQGCESREEPYYFETKNTVEFSVNCQANNENRILNIILDLNQQKILLNIY